MSKSMEFYFLQMFVIAGLPLSKSLLQQVRFDRIAVLQTKKQVIIIIFVSLIAFWRSTIRRCFNLSSFNGSIIIIFFSLESVLGVFKINTLLLSGTLSGIKIKSFLGISSNFFRCTCCSVQSR